VAFSRITSLHSIVLRVFNHIVMASIVHHKRTAVARLQTHLIKVNMTRADEICKVFGTHSVTQAPVTPDVLSVELHPSAGGRLGVCVCVCVCVLPPKQG